MMIARGRLPISLFLLVTAVLFGQTVRIAAQSPLVWDAVSKEYSAKIGETNIYFTFSATNLSPADVIVTAVRSSCGCTIPKLPPLPWRLGPGTNGEIQVLVDIRGKHGTLSKVVTVDTSSGFSLLAVNVKIPEDRSRNMQLAAADRQAVFRNECASCHVYPTYGKKGEPLYQTACGICHESDHRASMVPDLKALTKPTNHDYWDTWVRKGKAGTLMPAFSTTEGGPLNDEQVKSLVEYLSKKFTVVDLGNPFQTQ